MISNVGSAKCDDACENVVALVEREDLAICGTVSPKNHNYEDFDTDRTEDDQNCGQIGVGIHTVRDDGLNRLENHHNIRDAHENRTADYGDQLELLASTRIFCRVRVFDGPNCEVHYYAAHYVHE